MTSFYDRHIMPRLITCCCSASTIAKQREKVVPRAAGKVLEIGVGGGLNLAFYDPRAVSELTGIDPSAELRQRASDAPRPEGLNVDIREGAAEALPFEDASFDCIVCTFTLCTVKTPAKALSEAKRVLKPGGRYLFCEHGLAPDAGVARWQRRVEPIWRPLGGGCHLTRPITSAIEAAGFAVAERQSMYLPSTPRIFGWNEWGEARAA
jgi:ubiquinone/menaquinone biosynthesis C-methylase UbiE